jgi:hypothetical protein
LVVALASSVIALQWERSPQGAAPIDFAGA